MKHRYHKRPIWIPGVVTGAMTAVSFLFLLVAALVGCGPTPSPDTPGPGLLVTSFAPVESQGMAGTTAAVRVRFNAPVVDGDRVGRTLASAPAAMTPSVRVAASWTDRQTLLLRPTSPMKPSTRYLVTLSDRLPGLQGKTRFSFVHRPLTVSGLSGADLSHLPPAPTLIVHFNQPVLAGEVARGCALGRDSATGSLPLRTPDRDVVTSAVHLRPDRPLRQGVSYTLRCAGLRGHGGDAALDRPFVRKLRTYPRLKVVSFGPAKDNVPSDEVPVTLSFSTPVKLAAVRAAISMRPWARGIQRGTLDSSGTRYTALLDLKVTTRYSIHLDRRLRDVHGQRLGRWLRYAFTTSDASPRMTLERGIYALESSREGYPVWTRNVRGFQVECARVPEKRIVRLLTSSMNYDPWYASSSDRDLDWRGLGLRRRRHKVRVRQAKNRWKLTRLDLGKKCGGSKNGHGLYLAELRSRDLTAAQESARRYRPRQRVLANVTNLGVLLKVGPASGLVWVTSIDRGRPVPGATVTVYDLRGKRVHRATTDREGLVRLPGSNRLLRQPAAHAKNSVEGDSFDDDYDIYRAQRLIVVVRKAADMAVVDGNWQNGIQIWNFGVPVDRSGGRSRMRGFIQSDRGIYRPGEKVHFKGLVRETMLGRAPRVPGRATVAVHVEDSRGATILRRRLRLSRFGGFSFDLRLGQGAALGDYHVTASVAKQTFRERFMVEEFRKVSYEVELLGHERHTRRARKQRFSLRSRYLFGAPVKDARVSWTIRRRPHRLRFASCPQYTFYDNAARGRYFWWEDLSTHPVVVTEGDGRTDRRGRYAFSFVDAARGLDGPQDYLVQATITDETDQSVSQRAVRTVHATDLYLGLHAQEYVQAVDMPFAVNTVAMAPGGKQVAARGTLSYLRERYDCRPRSNGHRAGHACKRRHVKVWSRRVNIPATGNGVERVMPKTPGEYIVRLESTDSRGRRVTASTYVWIIGKGQAFWSGDESARLSLVASKRIYSPGDTARLVPRANMAGAAALVTLERGGVLDAFVTSLQTSGSGLKVPLRGRHAPNVFASVALVRGRTGEGDAGRPRFKMGVVDLKVSPDTSRLSVRVHTERPTYEPGQRVKGTLEVKDHRGKPVRAEVSLSVADEGVLQLIAYQTPDPMKTFYRPFGLGVDSSTNLNRIARLNDPAVNDPDEGGDSGGARGARVRSRFMNSAFWAPGLVTDQQGTASFAFNAPDNLTAFRLMAVAADSGSRFGSGDARMTVRKPLLAKPVLPRFLRAGDQAELGVVVHNYTGRAGTVTVRAHASGVSLSRRVRRMKVGAGTTARASFAGEVGFTARSRVRFSVSMGKHADALAVTLPVHRQMTTRRRTLWSGEVDGQKTVSLSWPKDLLAADSRLEVTMDRTGLGQLRGGLRYLIQYPYGCLEQTLSRFIPLTKVKDLARSLNMPQLRGPRLRTFTRAGVAKVLRHQHDTGHFSLWPGRRTYPHLTTYAMYGLNEARRARIRVDRGAMDRGARAMSAWANSSQRSLRPGGEIATMAMAAFVLADLGKPDAGLNARLFEARRALPRYGQAFLLRALKRAGAPAGQLSTLQRALVASVKGVPGQDEAALVRESFKGRSTFDSLHWYMSSDVRTTAIALSALIEAAPQSPVVARLARGLEQARRANGRWYNTQDNLYALVALSDLARSRARGSARVSVALDGRGLLRARLKGSRVLTLSRPLSKLKPGTLTLRSRGKVRYAVRLLLARRVSQDKSADRGFAISRQYLDASSGQPVSALSAGQLVRVKITVRTPKDRAYVALVDPLPAGLEAVNTRLSTSRQQPPSTKGPRRWWYRPRPTWSHKELRDDQARFFSDRMAAGTYTLEYQARATTRGTFTAAPTHAEAMYQPDISGHSTAARIMVK